MAQKSTPDTVRAGIYLSGIHDIDFIQNDYAINFWLWLKYKNKEFDFEHNLEIPDAKSVIQTISAMDSSMGEYYLLLKLQCVMKESWKVVGFPYDHQKMRISIENSMFDLNSLIFIPDTKTASMDSRFTLRG